MIKTAYQLISIEFETPPLSWPVCDFSKPTLRHDIDPILLHCPSLPFFSNRLNKLQASCKLPGGTLATEQDIINRIIKSSRTDIFYFSTDLFHIEIRIMFDSRLYPLPRSSFFFWQDFFKQIKTSLKKNSSVCFYSFTLKKSTQWNLVGKFHDDLILLLTKTCRPLGKAIILWERILLSWNHWPIFTKD